MIKLLVMDVDGTLTDGKLYFGESGEVFKSFDVKDGCGIKDILPEYNILPIIITARNSVYLEKRCKELGIVHLYQGVREKRTFLEALMEKFSVENAEEITYANVAYIGDDILDMQCMIPVRENGGLIGCPADAVLEVKGIAQFISSRNGGCGAVRDFINYIIALAENEKKKSIERKVSEAIRYIATLELAEMQVGTYTVNPEFYFMLQEYTTKDISDCRYEIHRKYIDIQMILTGEEQIDLVGAMEFVETEAYDEKKDVAFGTAYVEPMQTILRDGSFVVIYPGQGHKPSIAVNGAKTVRKLVAKILVG